MDCGAAQKVKALPLESKFLGHLYGHCELLSVILTECGLLVLPLENSYNDSRLLKWIHVISIWIHPVLNGYILSLMI